MILIITSKRDGHVEAVSKHLTSAGASWVRVNTEDLATNVEVEIEPAKGTGKLRLKDSGKEICVEEVSAVWYRKPDPVGVQHFEMDPAALEYVEAEFNEIILGLYSLLNRAYWINNPFRTRIAHRKMLQLRTAVEVGFVVPQTLITNKPDLANKFAEAVGGDLAIKSLGAISVVEDRGDQMVQYGIFTRRITGAELSAFSHQIEYMPTLFQKFIAKKAELRITCVGRHVFACKIQTRTNDITADDYRFDTSNLDHTAVDCPELTPRLHSYLKALGLEFGCFDFIVPEEGEPIFLECNCNGQFAWVENYTGQPIGLAIAAQLLQHSQIGQKLGCFFSNCDGEIAWEEKSRIEYADLSGAKVLRQEFSVVRDSLGGLYKGDEQTSSV